MKLVERFKTASLTMSLFVYAVVSLVLLGPLLAPGFVLTLDMVFTPRLEMPEQVTSSYLLHTVLHVLGLVLPADVVQKLLLVVILLLTGIGMHRLVVQLRLASGAPVYAAGLLYMVNPFTYERFMAGQYNVLFGYALLPWFVSAMFRLVAVPVWRRSLAAAAWALLISIVSVHSVVPAVLVALVIIAWRIVGGQLSRKLCLQLAIVAIVWLGASTYWLLPVLTGDGSQAQLIGSFSSQDSQAFATAGDSVIGRLINVVRLQGFWAERYGLFELPQSRLPLIVWGIVLLAILLFVSIGLVSLWLQGRRGLFMLLAAVLVSGLVLGSGIGGSWWGQLPLLSGYREPQKLAMLVAFAYALLVPLGLRTALDFTEQRKMELTAGALVPIAVAMPFLLTMPYLWGGGGQLRAVQYPSSWYMLRDRLESEPRRVTVLSLPWHLYAHTGFAGRVIANPAPQFFDVSMIASDDPEFAGVAYSKPTAASRQFDTAIERVKNGGDSKSFTAALQTHDVQYVMLTKENDYKDYSFLTHQVGLQLVADYKEISLYRVTANTNLTKLD